MQKTDFEIKLNSDEEMILGIVCMFLGFMMPLFLNVENFGILEDLRTVYIYNQLPLLIAAAKLILLNFLRAAPHYLGVFMVAESVEVRYRKKEWWYINVGMVFLLLQLTYFGIDRIHHIHYDFGFPAFIAAGFIILFEKQNYRYVDLNKKIMLLLTTLLSVQFMDVMPAADLLPIGRGEISKDIKMLSYFLDMEQILNACSIMGMVIFVLFSVMFLIMLKSENQLKEMAILREQNEQIRTEARLKEIQNRTYQEMQHLVHDLKSPLTVVQTLAGVLHMQAEAEDDKEHGEILVRIEKSVDQMSQMISEILYEDRVNPISVHRLLKRVSAQLSIEDYAEMVNIVTALDCDNKLVSVNSVLFSRALVNLVQNAVRSVPDTRVPEVSLMVGCREDEIGFTVMDNGCGIEQEYLEHIWERGYSGRGSSGIGLAFVDSVVKRSGGRINLETKVDVGTRITLVLPEWDMEVCQNEDR